ncbi:hypothetical protein HAPAU_03340 [Halalkalicoccus paucihalophilus]|uniref:DUF3099 domain-containing protein n=1 Tax=Halalkalicoccus paucihalophilus TaxID=1008153 RepID=A0A151AJ12_9EURY|nr:hypothetical protein [Halalkalicoccus paucihalophilus]KYH27666.1 hypothetical protein HAPAU_03340 [Halalkalicoccus paucihalophilus]
MTARTDFGTPIAKRARGFWAYYRRYTTTAIHAAATAALTAFGLLIFIDSSFAWLAIAAYVLPPVVLYATGSAVGEDPDDRDAGRPEDADRARPPRVPDVGGDRDADGSDADSDGVDTDHDGPDGDSDGIDRDTDGPDLDSDGIDRDSDGRDTDTDSDDSDGADTDRDG